MRRSLPMLVAHAATLALLALAGAGPAAAAVPPLQITLGDSTLVIPPALVQGAVDLDAQRTVTVTGPVGRQTQRSGGTSARALIQALGLPLDALERLEVRQGPGGRPVVLSGAEVRDGFTGDPACDACQASFSVNGSGDAVGFLRPMRSAADANESDVIAARASQTLIVRPELRMPSNALRFKLAGPANVKAGSPAAFSVTIDGAPANARIRWFLGDGTLAEGPTTSHRFGRGYWRVSVLVTTPDSWGAYTRIVRATRPRGDTDADDPLARGPAATPRPTPRPTSTPPPPGGTGPAAPAATVPPPTQAPATRPPSTPAPTPVAPTPSPLPTLTPTPPPATPPAAAAIRGRLAGEAAPPPLAGALTAAEALTQQPSSAPPAPPAPRGDSMRVAGSAASGMLLIGLLGAGALVERRRARRGADLLA